MSNSENDEAEYEADRATAEWAQKQGLLDNLHLLSHKEILKLIVGLLAYREGFLIGWLKSQNKAELSPSPHPPSLRRPLRPHIPCPSAHTPVRTSVPTSKNAEIAPLISLEKNGVSTVPPYPPHSRPGEDGSLPVYGSLPPPRT